MNCPICNVEMKNYVYQNNGHHCWDCRIVFYSAEEISENCQFCDGDAADELYEFAKQHPSEPGYWFGMTGKYYTLTEMERMVRLKAFL